MPLLDRGQTFIDHKATNHQGTKPKYFIALTSADQESDLVVCFVMNTEHRLDLMNGIGCNKKRLAYIIEPGTFSFITGYTTIFLRARAYYLSELLNSPSIELLDVASDELCRKIRHCLDTNEIENKFLKMINAEFS